MRKTLKIGWRIAALAAVLVPACKKQPVAVSADKSTSAEKQAAAAAVAPVSRATHLGFAQHLPASTEVYFSTLNLPAHYAAVKDSNYFKDLSAFVGDRVPAPSAATVSPGGPSPKKPVPLDPAKAKALERLAGADFFIAMGKGATKPLSALRDLGNLYTEMTYRLMMSGMNAPGPKADGAPGAKIMPSAAFLAAIMREQESVKRIVDVMAALELPSITYGCKVEKPEEVLKALFTDDILGAVRKKGKVSEVTSNLNGKFTLIEFSGKDLLTDEVKKLWFSGMPPEAEAVKPDLERLYAAYQAKSFAFSYGTAAGHMIITIGSSRPDFQFVTDPATSLAMRPEFNLANSALNKDLAGVLFVDETALKAMQNPQPLQPLLRGLLSGLKSSPMFSGLAKVLEPKVEALGPLQEKVYSSPVTTLAGLAWWDKGLHLELDGGLTPKGFEGSKPLKFASLVDDPNVVLAADFHRALQYEADVRGMIEGLADLVHAAALELAKAGLFGEQGAKMASWIDLEILPQVVSFYNARNTLSTKALGDEAAVIFDLGGRQPVLPGLQPPDPKADPKMLRETSVAEVVDRKVIGESWTQMNAAINGLTKAFPMLAGQKLPEAEVSNKSGVTIYSYPSPFESDDLTLSSAVSDKLFMVGTSKSLQEDIATRLLRAAPTSETSIALWRVNWPRIGDAVKNFAPTEKAATPPAVDNAQAAVKWLAPFGDLRGRLWIETGHVRNSIHWDIKDTKKFD